MNIKHYLSAAAALVLMAACSEYDPGMSGEVVNYTDDELATIQEYAKNFKEHFGGIDPDHTWGFGEKGSEDEMGTRTTANQPNNNQWVHITINQATREIENITTIDGQKIPGFPSDVDDLYHIWKNTGSSDYADTEAINYEQLAQMVHNGTDEIHPCGDVTDEEILYVSAWFRNNQNPDPDNLNVDKYFTQCISKDYDRTQYASTDGLINEGTLDWSEGNGVGEWNKNIPIHYYKDGVLSNVDMNGKDVTNEFRSEEFSLDQLEVKAPNDKDYVHIYNNNAGNTSLISSANPTAINTTTWSALTTGSNPNKGIVSDKSYRSIMYVNESGTTDFRAYSSGQSEWEYKWVLKHLTFTGRDGNDYDGWYLAFDVKYYRVVDTNTKDGVEWKEIAEKDYDGYYSNYIVKIVPGEGVIQHNWYRIMCEDLGNTYDYDFNDLVYDVYYTGEASPYTAHIKVQAAGGTYPIFIGQHDDAHEAHGLLGYADKYNAETGLYQPVNVGTGCDNGTAEEFTLSVNSTNPDDILIYVEKPGTKNAREKNDFSLPKVHEASDAPQKICIPGNKTRWTLENRNIEWAYPNFTNWVLLETDIYDFGKSSDWTKTGVQTNHLFY